MEVLVVFLIIIIIIGAILGGRSFGGTIRAGCGFFIALLILIIGYWLFIASPETNEDSAEEAVSSRIDNGYFIVKRNCETYTKPNKDSEISGYVEAGQEMYIENLNKYNYFYELKGDDGTKSYILKENLIKKPKPPPPTVDNKGLTI